MSIKSVAEYHLRKLPHELEDMIRWWATEPSPTATCFKDTYTEEPEANENAGWLHTWWYHKEGPHYHWQWFPANFVGVVEDGWLSSAAANPSRITKAWWENEIEQDRIAKALEPVVAEYNLRKLPTTLVDENIALAPLSP